MARVLSIIFSSVFLVQGITCQCIGNFNGPYPGPGLVPEVGYPGPGFIGNNFGPELPFGGPGCFNPGFPNEIPFPGPGPYNSGLINDFGLPGSGFLNGPDCGPFPELIGFGGPGFLNQAFGPDFGGPFGGPIGPAFGEVGGPGFFNGFASEVGYGPGFSGPFPNAPCSNFAQAPLNLPCQNVQQIAPAFEPAPFSMPPTGMSIYSDDLIIEGPVIVSGRMPFLGAVAMEGAFTSAGAGAVSYTCMENGLGEGPLATVAPSFGFAPAMPLGLPYGGLSGPGLGCANRVY